jgi:hypothetical protein
MTLDEIAKAGERIVVGRVLSSTCRWGEGKKMIWTDYTVQVDETWKGQAGQTIVVSVAGGRVDGKSIEVTHVPRLLVGGTYVLCLYGNEHLYGSPVVGSEQGAFREVVLEGEAGPNHVLVNVDDALVALTPQGRLVAGERLERTADGSAMRRAQTSSAPLPRKSGFSEPVFRDGDGKVVTPSPTKKLRGIEGSPEPLTRATLKDAVRRALRASDEVTR